MFSSSLRSSFSLIRRAPTTSPLTSTLLHHHYRFLSQQARSQIQSAISASPVVLFMKGTPERPECGFSRAVVQVLGLHNVPADKLKTYNVLADDELRSGIKEFSEWPTVPQIYVNGEFVGGCDILLGMHQSGELEKLLEKENIIPPISDATDVPPTTTTA